jgi:hypothetical protein
MAASMAALLIDKPSFYDHLKAQYLHDVTHAESTASTVEENQALPIVF